MAAFTAPKSAVQVELFAQWRSALAAKCAAEADGDGWLAELMAGRLEDLRDLVSYHGMLDAVPIAV
jgi:hypothetical protein